MRHKLKLPVGSGIHWIGKEITQTRTEKIERTNKNPKQEIDFFDPHDDAGKNEEQPLFDDSRVAIGTRARAVRRNGRVERSKEGAGAQHAAGVGGVPTIKISERCVPSDLI